MIFGSGTYWPGLVPRESLPPVPGVPYIAGGFGFLSLTVAPLWGYNLGRLRDGSRARRWLFRPYAIGMLFFALCQMTCALDAALLVPGFPGKVLCCVDFLLVAWTLLQVNQSWRGTFYPSKRHSTGKREPPHIPRQDPVLGWKTLQVVPIADTYLLKGPVDLYGVDATATCRGPDRFQHPDHPSPDWGCRCGFYALAERPEFYEYGIFLARVELFGTVIEGDRGWRASRQRVLGLQARPICPFGDRCSRPVGFLTDYGHLFPVCAHHGHLYKDLYRRTPLLTLADLSAAIGTEVTWGPDLPTHPSHL